MEDGEAVPVPPDTGPPPAKKPNNEAGEQSENAINFKLKSLDSLVASTESNGEKGAKNSPRRLSGEKRPSTEDEHPTPTTGQSSKSADEPVGETPPETEPDAVDNADNEAEIRALRNEIAATESLLARKAREWDGLLRIKKAKELELEKRLRAKEVRDVVEGEEKGEKEPTKGAIRVANLPLEPIKAPPPRRRPAPASKARQVSNKSNPQPRTFILNNAVSSAPMSANPVRIVPVSAGISAPKILTPTSVLQPNVPLVVTSTARVTPIIPSSRPIDVSLGSRAAQQLLMAQQASTASASAAAATHSPVLIRSSAGKTFTLQNPVAAGAPASGTSSAIIVPDGSRHSIKLTEKANGARAGSLQIASVHSNAAGGNEIDIKPTVIGLGDDETATDLFDCDNCKKGFAKLLECTGCNSRWFCSENCQIEDWETHHETCGES